MSTTQIAFAAEAGIVQALEIARRLLSEKASNRVAVFCGYDHDEPDDTATEALEQFLALKDKHLDRLALNVITQREAEEAPLLSGQLDGARVRALAGRFFDPARAGEYFVCGPESFAQEVASALTAAGVDAARIRVERCEDGTESAPTAGSAAGIRETQVSFVMDGRRRSFTMRTDDESILDAATRAGIELPFSCKAGVCSTCRTKLVKGKVDLAQNYALEDWELEQGFILACQAHARTPEIELTYDET